MQVVLLLFAILALPTEALTGSGRKATCNLDEHHPENGGFYIEGIAGAKSAGDSPRDENGHHKRADNTTWAPHTYYPYGELKICTGIFCDPAEPPEGSPQYRITHTCARLRFTYRNDSDVWELPSKEALDACDFSNAVLKGDADAGEPNFDILIDTDHEKKIYFYASKGGCSSGQKVAVKVIESYEDNFAACIARGRGSSRIRSCDCNFRIRDSTVIDPCHTGFVYGCLQDMPVDTSCCPVDPENITSPSLGVYVHAYGGSVGTCIAQSAVAKAKTDAALLKVMIANKDPKLDVFDGYTSCPSMWYDYSNYDPVCATYKALQKCNVAVPPTSCESEAIWLEWNAPPPAAPSEPPAESHYFTDDDGKTHVWYKAKPLIVGGAMDALTLLRFGLPVDQVKATWGERATSGSNINGNYYDGNTGEFHSNGQKWGDVDYDALNFPSDPSTEEQAMLAQIADLSPGCSASNYWCNDFDVTVLDQVGWPDLIIEGAFHGAHKADAAVIAKAKEKGIPIISLKRLYHSEEGENAVPKGFIEIARQYEKLATALGVDVEASDEITQLKIDLCNEVTNFKRTAGQAQMVGLRVLAGYLPYGHLQPSGEVTGFLMSPEKDPVLTMLEELGMPILHVDAPQTSSWESLSMSATELTSSGGRTGGRVKVQYLVDFFLYDSRVTLDFTGHNFSAAWPHPAVVNKQYAYWASGGHVYTYDHAKAILKLVGKALSTSKRLHSEITTCTAVVDLSSEVHSSTGLAPGEYACFNPVVYPWCTDVLNAATWESKANAAGWRPCAKSVALARKRKLSQLERDGASSSAVDKELDERAARLFVVQ